MDANDVLVKAPPLEIPVPFNVNGSAFGEIPFKSKHAPELTTVPVPIAPKAATLFNFKVPSLIVVIPE